MQVSIMGQLQQAGQSTVATELDKINQEIAETKEKKAKAQKEKQQYENELARLQQRDIHKERNKRTRRLIERGAILEKAIGNADRLTNEQIQELLYAAFSAPAITEKMRIMLLANGM